MAVTLELGRDITNEVILTGMCDVDEGTMIDRWAATLTCLDAPEGAVDLEVGCAEPRRVLGEGELEGQLDISNVSPLDWGWLGPQYGGVIDEQSCVYGAA